MTVRLNRQWLLARRPRGAMSAEDFRWAESGVPEPAPGEILVRNACVSCDPTQRAWIAGDTYLPAVRIGEVVRAFGVGKVVASRDPRFRPGQLVEGLLGWQDYALVGADTLVPPFAVPPGVAVEEALGVLGHTGITAYFGLLDVGRPKPGETVVVSGAAGATGSVVGQIARLKGCRAVGIAGGAEKCRYLTDELGFDAAIDYRSENVVARLRQACPDGIDVYFENVGGRLLEAALAFIALRGRVVLCVAIATYDGAAPPPGPSNYMKLVSRRARMEGFLVLDYMPRAEEAISAMAEWIRSGKLKHRVDVQDGLENAPTALARLFRGENRGKQLLRIADPAALD